MLSYSQKLQLLGNPQTPYQGTPLGDGSWGTSLTSRPQLEILNTTLIKFAVLTLTTVSTRQLKPVKTSTHCDIM